MQVLTEKRKQVHLDSAQTVEKFREKASGSEFYQEFTYPFRLLVCLGMFVCKSTKRDFLLKIQLSDLDKDIFGYP